MLSAIHFNHDHRVQTYKIEDVICEGMLPAKFEVSDLLAAQAIPEKFLCVGLIFAKATLQFWLEDGLVGLTFHLQFSDVLVTHPPLTHPHPNPPLEGEGHSPIPT